MFCPRCAAHNIDDARYCRVCGADISLLPQMLSGQLNVEPADADETAVDRKSKRKRKEKEEKEKAKQPPTLEKAFENIGVGVAFLVISVMIARFMPGGRLWWFWMLIPALACAGEGIGQLMRLKSEKSTGSAQPQHLRASSVGERRHLPPRDTAEMLMPPPSITEHTTRHLGAERSKSKPDEPALKSLDEPAERPPRPLDSELK
ncbi:MAG: hypothetical protein QOF02_4177 [Blastocatellia bacterium]|nr:hypothetical protein [Blastocatellia bacterium]